MASILVFGATGSVGSQVCRALAKRSTPFRAAVHTISKADNIKKLANNVEIVEVDMAKNETVDAALKGITKVFLLIPPFAPPQVGFATIDAIKKAGTVKHIVKLSAAGTEDGGKFFWAKEHHEFEEAIRKAGIPLTSIRPTSFDSNIFHQAHNIKQGSFENSAGDARMNWISPKDIGEISAVSLIEGEKHYGRNYVVTGPETVTGHEVAKAIGGALGKEITFKPLTIPQTKESVSRFMPPKQVDEYCEMFTYFSKGGYDRQSNDLETVTGTKGQTISEWVQENKFAFA